MYLFIAANIERKANLYLIDRKTERVLARKTWEHDRNLSQDLLPNINNLLKLNHLRLEDLKGLGVFAGPAGFTDLRITHTVANALAYGLKIPVVNSAGQTWRSKSWQKLNQGGDFKIITPSYGRPASITKRKK